MFINAENWPRPRHGRLMTKQIPNAVSGLVSAPCVGPPLFASGSINFFFFFFFSNPARLEIIFKKILFPAATVGCHRRLFFFFLFLLVCFSSILLFSRHLSTREGVPNSIYRSAQSLFLLLIEPPVVGGAIEACCLREKFSVLHACVILHQLVKPVSCLRYYDLLHLFLQT